MIEEVNVHFDYDGLRADTVGTFGSDRKLNNYIFSDDALAHRFAKRLQSPAASNAEGVHHKVNH